MNEGVVIDAISKRYGLDSVRSIEAIHDVTFSVERGEISCVLGPSGCGKSTLLNIIAGFVEPTSGSVTVFGRDHSDSALLTTYVQQSPQLLPYRRVLANAALGIELRKELSRETLRRVSQFLRVCGLNEFLSHYPNELSRGMQQRVALVRGLAVTAPLILCDEPLSSLDFDSRFEVEEFFWRECKGQERTSVFVTHQIDSAISLADRIVVLSPRPARVLQIIQVAAGLRALSPRERRQSREFLEFYSATESILREIMRRCDEQK